MSIFIEKDGKKTLPGSFYIKILVFLSLIGLSVISMQPLQAALNDEISVISGNFLENIENFTGLQVRYSSIRPAFFGSFDIRNLRFYRNDETFFTVARIQINFSVIEFLFNKNTFIHAVIIDRPVINIDVERDKETLDFFTSLINRSETTPEFDISFLPRDADYQIRHGYFSLTDRYTLYKIEDANLNIKETDGEIFVNGRLSAEYKQSGYFDKSLVVRTELALNGNSDADLQRGNAEVSVFHITCYEQDEIIRNISFFRPPSAGSSPQLLFSVLPFKIVLDYDDGLLKIKNSAENPSVNYYFHFAPESGNFSAGADFNNFHFGEQVIFSEDLKSINEFLLMEINGSAFYMRDNGSAEYNVNLGSVNPVPNFVFNARQPLNDSFLINLYGDEKRINVNDFSFSSSGKNTDGFFFGRAGFKGVVELAPYKAAGQIVFDRFSLTGNDDFSAVFNAVTTGNEVHISTEYLSIARGLINDIDIFLYPAQNDLGISVSVYSENEGAVFIDALYNNNPGLLEASMILDSISAFELTELTRPFSNVFNMPAFTRGLLQNSSVNAEVFFSSDFNNNIYNAPNIIFNIGGINGIVSLSGSDHQFNINQGLISNNINDLNFSANMNFSNPMDLIFEISAGFNDLAWLIEGQIIDRTTMIIKDPNGLNAYGNIDNSGALTGYIEGHNFPVLVALEPVYLNFYSSLRYSDIDFWNLDVNYLTAHAINTMEQEELLRISGSMDQDGASFREILYSDSTGILTGSADFSWDIDFSYLEFIVNITDGLSAGENYSIEGVYKDEIIDVRAEISNMHLNRFLKNSNPVLISADAAVYWDSINSFNAQINLSSLQTKIQNELLHASVGLNFTDNELLIRNLRLNYGEIKAVLPQLHINLIDGFAKARADFNGEVFSRNMEAAIGIDINFNSINSWGEIWDTASIVNGVLIVEDIQYGALKEEKIEFNFSFDEGAVLVNGGINNMIRLDMDKNGYFFLGVSDPFPIRGAFSGVFRNGHIEAHCSNYYIDLSTLYSLVASSDDFNIAGGYITGQIDIIGDVLNPHLNGYGRASSMRFQVPNYLGDDIRTVPFIVLTEGHEMTFGPVTAAVGTGAAFVEGRMLFQNWYPSNIGLDINIPYENPVPYDFDISGFLAKGDASGNLEINADTRNYFMELSGSLFTNEADLSLRGLGMDEAASFDDDYEVNEDDFNAFVDLTIIAGSMVEFIWPSVNPIIRAKPDIGTVITVTADTQAGQFNIDGDVKIRAGEIYYLGRSFFIRQGNMTLNESETEFDPRFSARAEIRDRTDAGPVTISMIVDNQPLKSFEPKFEASPSLTQLEIFSFLGQNFNSLQGEDNTDLTQRVIIASTADVVSHFIAGSDVMSQMVFFRQFERQVRDLLGLDMFSVRTRFLQNAFITGASGNPFGTGGNIVGNYFDNTTVFIGKYVGQHLFIQGMLTMRYDQNSTVFGGLRFEPDIGIELQSPFVNIRWDFFPYHPENWWVNDNSITLSWSMSF
ncbi:MAG: translocation/assembly module TamB [Treponema sp.]|nr:translocation/assembly module TamB [Treponema sp.]